MSLVPLLVSWVAIVAGVVSIVASGNAGTTLAAAPIETVPDASHLCARYSGLPERWGDDLHAGMVHLAGGEFVLGTTLGYSEERSTGKVRVGAFWIDRTEVTVAQFAAFAQATGYVTDAERAGGGAVFSAPEDKDPRAYAWWSYVKGASWKHPRGFGGTAASNAAVTLVTQADALAYAKWLGRDLPTEVEWEYAGKAGRADAQIESEPRDAGKRPTANFWQGAFPMIDTREDGYGSIAPVGCFAPNDFGLYDLIGNAWEWTRDRYTGRHQSHLNGDPGQVSPERREPAAPAVVIKGGSFLCSRDFCARYRASAREPAEPDLPASHIGFRTVLRVALAGRGHLR